MVKKQRYCYQGWFFCLFLKKNKAKMKIKCLNVLRSANKLIASVLVIANTRLRLKKSHLTRRRGEKAKAKPTKQRKSEQNKVSFSWTDSFQSHLSLSLSLSLSPSSYLTHRKRERQGKERI